MAPTHSAWIVLLALAGTAADATTAVPSGGDVHAHVPSIARRLHAWATTRQQPVATAGDISSGTDELAGSMAGRSLLDREEVGMYGQSTGDYPYGGIRGRGGFYGQMDADQAIGMTSDPFILLFNTYQGGLTYYGGAGEQGMCAQSWVPPGFTTVALNAPQFGNGEMCGTCIRACYNDLGLGMGERCFDAIIDNVCPECDMGDIDLGENGDGEWPVEWEPIICPVQEAIVTTQGSNIYYGKIKIEGGPSSVNWISCADSQGGVYLGERTSDGFWEVNSGSGAFECGLDCTVGYSCCYSLGFGTAGPDLFGSDGSGC